MDEQHHSKKNESFFQKYSLALMGGGILIVFLVGLSFLNSYVNTSKSGVVFPAGVNYLGDEKEGVTEGVAPTQAPIQDFDTLAQSTDWVELTSKQFPYVMQHPKQLTPLFFPNDPNYSVTFQVGAIPAELNIMFVVESISRRDSKYVGNVQGFVSNYWRFFGGLKGLESSEYFENEKGLQGYKAVYTTKAGAPTTTHIFLQVPDDDDHLLHLANIFPSEALFNRIVNSVDIKK